MLEKIKALTEKMRANIEHRGHLAEVVEEIGAKVDEFEQRLVALEGRAVADLTAAIVPQAPAPAPALVPPFAPEGSAPATV